MATKKLDKQMSYAHGKCFRGLLAGVNFEGCEILLVAPDIETLHGIFEIMAGHPMNTEKVHQAMVFEQSSQCSVH